MEEIKKLLTDLKYCNDCIKYCDTNDYKTILSAGYDKIVYMDVAAGAKNEIYIAPVQTVANAIQTRLGRSKHYFQCSKKDVFSNQGLCVGISVMAFKNIEGVETITF